MRVVGLVSGGKDSCYNMVQAVAAGHEIVALANLSPRSKQLETDSAMFQTIGWNNIQLLADAMALPLFVGETDMVAKEEGKNYLPSAGDEVEDLYMLLEKVKTEIGVDAVCVGAILSDYQRVRVENVCLRLGLTPLAFLWRRDQAELLQEMVDTGMESILIKVACLGLTSAHLGLTLAEMGPHLSKLAAKYGVNVCGEGGEFETFTLNCPLFRRRLAIDSSSVVTHADDAFAPVCLLQVSLKMEGEERQGSQAELLGPELMERLSPRVQAAPLACEDNVANAPEVPTCQLDLSEEEEGTEEEDGGWFSVNGVAGRADDPVEAVKGAFQRLNSLLSAKSWSLDQLVKVYMYIDSMAEYKAMNAAYVTHFGLNPPVRVCVGVARLPKGAQVLLAAKGALEGRTEVLHVQGVSHWAPANIGPYSQGVQAANQLHVSGQIGLVPGSMEMAEGEAAQARLGLRHVERVAKAMVPSMSFDKVRRVVCYVLGEEGARQADLQLKAVDLSLSEVATYLMVDELPRGALIEWEVEYHHSQP